MRRLILFLLLPLVSFGQGIQKQEKVAGLNAFTYYPVGYETGKKFPLILFFPGKGETGTQASLLLRNGPNKFTAAGWKPDALVISVQPTVLWVNEGIIDKVLADILNRYQVDTASIHVTGLSAGATGIEQFALTPAYADKITTVVSMSAPEVATYYKNIPATVLAGVKWLGFCGSQDAPYDKMKDLFNRITAAGGSARFIAGTYGHCCWNDIYNPAYKLPGTGENIYDWMIAQGKPTTPPLDTSTKVLQILHDPAKVQKIIILDKDGRWTEYHGNSISTGYLKLEFQ